MSNAMFDACTQGGGFMFFIGLLLLAVLGLGIAALAKYLFWSKQGPNSHVRRLAPRASDAGGNGTWPV